jgi:D-glycero-alpha-D-manno-heptose 1-phosphate guanylyltransferase
MEMSSIVAVVLAGGQGTRIRHLLPEIPKPMAPVRGRPFVEWIVRYLARQGITRVIIGTGYKAGVIEEHFAASPVKNIQVACVREDEPLGTAGGFLHAMAHSPFSGEAWLVLNGDSLVFTPLAPLVESLRDPAIQGSLLGVEMEDTARYGTLLTGADGQLRGFREKQPGAGLINSGVYLLRRELTARFSAQRPLAFETQVYPALLQAEVKLQAVPVRAPFLDIGTPESLQQAETFIGENEGWLLG